MNRQNKIKKYFNQKEKLTLKNKKYKNQVKWFTDFMLTEDLGETGDVTSDTILKTNPIVKAEIITKENGIIAGLEETKWLCTKYKIHVTKYKNDGTGVKKGEKIMQIKGKIKDILKLERTILNILQRMSGIATQTNKLVTKNSPLLCPTRKTQWGLLDKKAVILGGGGTHRLGLYDWILIKDNHLKQVTSYKLQVTSFYEIECKTEKQVFEFAKQNPCAIMLDNMKPKQITKIKQKLNKNYPEIIIEASGGINEKNIREYQKTGVDIISMGNLTHSTKVLDLSLNIC